MKRTLTAAALMLVACNEADHGHGHDHEEEAAVAPAEPAAAEPAPKAVAEAAPSSVTGTLGGGEARLEAKDGALRLSLVDASGAAVVPTGEARVVLTGTGEAPQRVVLTAGEGAWVGPAKVSGAPGYVAVVSIELDGNTESARLSWGEVPQVGDEHGHGDHGHGEHGDEGEHEGDEGHGEAEGDDRDHGHGH